MKLNRANAVLAILAIACAVLLVGSDEALASNMGFKENKQIFAQDGGPERQEPGGAPVQQPLRHVPGCL